MKPVNGVMQITKRTAKIREPATITIDRDDACDLLVLGTIRVINYAN